MNPSFSESPGKPAAFPLRRTISKGSIIKTKVDENKQ